MKIIDAGKFGGAISSQLPLFTKKGLAERWGKTVSNINMREKRHDTFPARITGVVLSGDAALGLYPFPEVLRYEREQGFEVRDHSNEQADRVRN